MIIEERRQRIDNDPGAQLGEMLQAALFLNHPYRLPMIGWEHEMRGLTAADDARLLSRAGMRPNNAVLVIAGDITIAEVQGAGREVLRPDPGAHDRRRASGCASRPSFAARG